MSAKEAFNTVYKAFLLRIIQILLHINPYPANVDNRVSS